VLEQRGKADFHVEPVSAQLGLATFFDTSVSSDITIERE
jgi:hypothetical protein